MGKAALVIVDCQNDFMPPDGALAVPNGDQVLPLIKEMLEEKKWTWEVVVATQDYHPPGHISFASRHGKDVYTNLEVTDGRGKRYVQTLWPEHAVQGTKGAEIVEKLADAFEPWKNKMKVARKAWHPDIEQYSAFEGYITEATDPAQPPSQDSGTRPIEQSEMVQYLRSEGVTKLVIVGLATDFCVCQTSMDALASRFETLLVAPAVRAVFAEKQDEVFDRVEKEGGKVVGRLDPNSWEDEVRDWLR